MPFLPLRSRRAFAAQPVLAVAGLLLAVAPLLSHAETTLERIAQRKVLVDVVDQSYPPFSFLNDHNEMDGFDVDVARAVAQRLGVKLRVETPAWEMITASRWRGRWDVCICSLTPDANKSQVLDFVAPYYQSPSVLVTTTQNAAIQSTRDMNGKRIGVEQGSSYERYLQKQLVILNAKPLTYPFDRVQVATYASEDLAFQDLALGAGRRLDAVVSNQVTAKARIARSGSRFRIVGEPLYLEPNWVAVDKGDVEFAQRLSTILGDLRKDGTLSRLSQKWLGQDVTQ